MSFSTLPFLFYFLPAFLAVYYIVPARFRNAVLALGSLLFYWLSAGTGALLVLVALILVNFAAGRLIEDAHGDERRAWLILALACDVGSLFYFKYMGWFLENLGRASLYFRASPTSRTSTAATPRPSAAFWTMPPFRQCSPSSSWVPSCACAM